MSLAVAAVSLCIWLFNKLDLVGKDRMRKDLDRLDIAGAPESARRQVIRCTGFAAYFLSRAVLLHALGDGPGLKIMKVALPLGAAQAYPLPDCLFFSLSYPLLGYKGVRKKIGTEKPKWKV